ncbi:MAG: glycosyltransferase family 39 protein [Deltaproteobacteria bacterium]|nr:glycosyltransferase family 39 protein [Deltaproteobacteria bacterium]
MNEGSDSRLVGMRTLLVAFALLCALALALAGRHLDAPGTYYDEVIQAEPAVQFLAEDGRPSGIPGARTIRLFGGWFPITVQPYMGALKSQLLIPVFAVFGASVPTLRLATLGIALIGLLFAMLWARETLGIPIAIASGLLLATDPSFLLTARHDWGSFALGFCCRCGGLYFLTVGWRRGSIAPPFVGGLLFGLGVYNKIDFGVFMAAAAVALALAFPQIVRESLRTWRRQALPVGLGVALGAAPMISGATAALSATGNFFRRQSVGPADWAEKLHTFAATLDGSYFHELMLSGGSFERMAQVPDPASSPFLVVFALSLVYLGVVLWRDRRAGELDPAQAFVWSATLLIAIGIFLTPRTVRIHHALNIYPFPHYVVALALARIHSRRDAGSGAVRRAASVAVLALLVAGNLLVTALTLEHMRSTGGKGRWSDSLDAFAQELSSRPGTVAVSLDWGFNGPLRFAARDLDLIEPVWSMRSAHRPGRAWRFSGTVHHVYLLFDEDFAVFDFGPKFLAAARELDPTSVEIRRHVDLEGDPTFVSVHFTRPHRLTYDGNFKIKFRRTRSRSLLH